MSMKEWRKSKKNTTSSNPKKNTNKNKKINKKKIRNKKLIKIFQESIKRTKKCHNNPNKKNKK
jgi:hypothetical protein